MTTTSGLGEVPLAGLLVEPLDKALLDAGMNPWLAQTAEFFLLVVLLYVVTGFLVRRGFPLLRLAARPVVEAVADTVMVLVLLPEFVFTRTLTRLRLSLPSVVYFYGDAVVAGNTAVKSAATGLVRALAWLQKRPKPFVIAFVFLFFLLWNVNTCLPGPAGCVTPVSQWTTGAGTWLDEQKVKGAR
ncbi:hypothetical protein SK803_12575 [Lentzea sp. BCCO 10_0856]|uniref:Uncharacterized protein n=1 Tax=Lentzea miocenica TaxID=3095431 RepID=A0ABU4SYR2_9PSEU|nr:hypothetical protein [Lentzea sp. BCCO 10_0856]MDX8031054.1 hypothetical protein [Lentzea sp. BCCO 10_0856]